MLGREWVWERVQWLYDKHPNWVSKPAGKCVTLEGTDVSQKCMTRVTLLSFQHPTLPADTVLIPELCHRSWHVG
jgi:hypothetical protein